MSGKLEFKKVEIEKVEKDYEKLQLTSEQRELISQSAKLYLKYIPVSEMAIKGFISRAMREWQIQNKIDMKETLAWPLEKQIRLTSEVIAIMKEMMTKILIKSEMEPALDAAFNEVFNFAKENLSQMVNK